MTPEEIHQKIRLVPYEAGFCILGIKQLCKWASELPNGITIFESGTSYGRSAFTWALATGGHITTVEPQDTQDLVLLFAKKFGLDGRVDAIGGCSDKMSWDKEFDVVWLDGNHNYEVVKKELEIYDPLAKLMICGHDYGHRDLPGVKKAVDEFYGGRVMAADNFWRVWK